jgi:RimJ/RimL family protein N-acetyltransferase
LKHVLETEIGKIIIREAQVTDAKKTVEFMNWVTGEVEFHTYGPNDFNIKSEDEERMIKVFQQRKNCLFLLAVFNEEIIAVATLSGGIKERTAHRSTLGITVAKRFWRLGIGMQMMAMILDYAFKTKEITKIELLVHENNKPALNLYEKLGFFKEGIIHRYFYIDGQYYNGIQMAKYMD